VISETRDGVTPKTADSAAKAAGAAGKRFLKSIAKLRDISINSILMRRN